VTDTRKWQSLQDSMALATNLAIITVDYKGIPITEHSRRQRFCTFMRNDPQTSRYCVKCDSHAGLEAARFNKTYTYLCYANVVDIAIPIIINEQYYGAVMAGQVLLPKEEDHTLDKVVTNSFLESQIYNDDNLQKAYNELPVLTFNKISEMTQMIENISKYVFEEALLRDHMYILCQTIIKMDGTNNPSKLNLANIDEIHEQLQKVEAHRNPLEKEANDSYNPLVRMAKNYVLDNIEKKITLKDTSKSLHVSESYLSRLFKKETKESFSSYVIRKKTEKAADALIATDDSISAISNHLGFSDCSYFIKLFNKGYGVTPVIYRRINKQG
jgi:ligand-binding sensor protein/AraC-like DNA-binding protein